MACLPGAISRDADTGTVLIDPDRCINCASCAMACPFGVIRYHADPLGPPEKVVAVKCDNCIERQSRGQVPACVEICKSGALTFEEISAAMKRKTDEVARTVAPCVGEAPLSPGFALLNAVKRVEVELRTCVK
jgi:carbon-monoxide dehydrogenase iron sulfur subunit